MGESVVQSRLQPVAAPERLEVEMLDIANRCIAKERVLKAFLAIFLPSVELHAFLLEAT